MASSSNEFFKYVGKDDWAYATKKGIFSKDSWKCNLFVQEALFEVKNLDIKVGKVGNPNTWDLKNKTYPVPHTTFFGSDISECEMAQIYIIIRENDSLSNHCGLLQGGMVVHASKSYVEMEPVENFLQRKPYFLRKVNC